MEITVNGKPQTCADDATLLSFLEAQGVEPKAVVAELNGEIVSAEAFAQTQLHGGDTLEILRFVGGG